MKNCVCAHSVQFTSVLISIFFYIRQERNLPIHITAVHYRLPAVKSKDDAKI